MECKVVYVEELEVEYKIVQVNLEEDNVKDKGFC